MLSGKKFSHWLLPLDMLLVYVSYNFLKIMISRYQLKSGFDFCFATPDIPLYLYIVYVQCMHDIHLMQRYVKVVLNMLKVKVQNVQLGVNIQ